MINIVIRFKKWILFDLVLLGTPEETTTLEMVDLTRIHGEIAEDEPEDEARRFGFTRGAK